MQLFCSGFNVAVACNAQFRPHGGSLQLHVLMVDTWKRNFLSASLGSKISSNSFTCLIRVSKLTI